VVVPFTKPEIAGDLNAIVIGWSDTTATVSSVIDSTGNQYQLAGGSATGATLSQSVYYCPSVAAGSDAVTVTFNTPASYPDVRILEYSGFSALDWADGTNLITSGFSDNPTDGLQGINNVLPGTSALVMAAVTTSGSVISNGSFGTEILSTRDTVADLLVPN
jgi:hypothetical protein